jgi:uncharacterized membrane protein YvlD (DUF360 family)
MTWLSFYRDQARLMWEWRAARLALIRRASLTYLASMAALLIISSISPDLTLDGPRALLLGGLLLTVLNGLTRPALLLLLSPLWAIAVPIAGLVIEVLIVLLVGQVVPGVGVGSLQAAIVDAVMLTILNAIFAEILRASDDDSYHGTQVRRLAGGTFGTPKSTEPGLLMIQIDGLSLPVLRNQMSAGRMPTLDRLVRSGESDLDPWFALLPPVTPVSQAGILHGNNDDMPGFRWFEKRSKTLLVANTPEGASEIVRRRSDGHGLLAEDGASIGNLVTGDAARSYLTMATIAEDLPVSTTAAAGQAVQAATAVVAAATASGDDSRRMHGIVVSQVNYIRLLVLTIGELAKEFYQRERQRSRGVEPRIDRNLHYAFERALTNVALRNLTTALVIEEMFEGAPAIYVDYTGYDALSHHVGPERAEAVDALDGLDRTIHSILKAGRETSTPYRLVVLSDHGQCLGSPFSQRFGELLEDVARRLMGDTSTGPSARQDWEYHGAGRMILGEMGRGRGLRRAAVRRAGRWRVAAPRDPEDHDLVACASGNLALLYLTFSEDRVGLEQIEEHYPDLIDGLLAHPGVGLVMVDSALHGPVVRGARGTHYLASGRIVGEDPLEPFGPRAAESLVRLNGFANTGDLVVIGPYDPDTGEVVSYEDLVGSHGGLGGRQGEPFLLHPADLPIANAPVVGATAVHAELRGWLETLRSGGRAPTTHEGVDPGPAGLGAGTRDDVGEDRPAIAAAADASSS